MENTTEFMQYGEEWKAEIKKLPKEVIINIFSQMGIEKQRDIDALKNRNRILENLNFKYRVQLGMSNEPMDLDLLTPLT